MENATKALLIAAAILIAILIISLALVVYRMAADTVGGVNLSEAEMATFNGKFEASAGPKVSGSSVNALLVAVASSNADPESKKEITVSGNSGAAVTKAGSEEAGYTYSVTKVSTGKYYSVTLQYSDGLVSTVTINKIAQ